MAEQISSENTKRILLEGNGAKAASSPRPIRSQRKMPADVVVENATEKRYLWTARAFAIVFAVSLCCNIILTYVIIKVMPLYRVEPYLFSFADKEEQIYKIEQVDKIYDYKYLTEMFVREYILLRNTIVNDESEMQERWGVNSNLREMSNNSVYNQFKKEMAVPALELVRQHNLTRNVKITSVTEVAGGRKGMYWQVGFRVEDMTPEQKTPKVGEWQATLAIRYRPKVVKYGERLKNPLGFTVEEYTQTKR
ncbi:MAG: type IV secretion system protein [Acetobacter sp.]|nr:type IV secretion system protein [Acetobacter sp.]